MRSTRDQPAKKNGPKRGPLFLLTSRRAGDLYQARGGIRTPDIPYDIRRNRSRGAGDDRHIGGCSSIGRAGKPSQRFRRCWFRLQPAGQPALLKQAWRQRRPGPTLQERLFSYLATPYLKVNSRNDRKFLRKVRGLLRST